MMPSNFEGFGIAALEAQASGLDVVCSDKVPKSVRQIRNVSFLPITQDAIDKWSEALLNVHTANRRDYVDYLKKSGYDIKNTIDHLINIYSQG